MGKTPDKARMIHELSRVKKNVGLTTTKGNSSNSGSRQMENQSKEMTGNRSNLPRDHTHDSLYEIGTTTTAAIKYRRKLPHINSSSNQGRKRSIFYQKGQEREEKEPRMPEEPQEEVEEEEVERPRHQQQQHSHKKISVSRGNNQLEHTMSSYVTPVQSQAPTNKLKKKKSLINTITRTPSTVGTSTTTTATVAIPSTRKKNKRSSTVTLDMERVLKEVVSQFPSPEREKTVDELVEEMRFPSSTKPVVATAAVEVTRQLLRPCMTEQSSIDKSTTTATEAHETIKSKNKKKKNKAKKSLLKQLEVWKAKKDEKHSRQRPDSKNSTTDFSTTSMVPSLKKKAFDKNEEPKVLQQQKEETATVTTSTLTTTSTVLKKNTTKSMIFQQKKRHGLARRYQDEDEDEDDEVEEQEDQRILNGEEDEEAAYARRKRRMLKRDSTGLQLLQRETCTTELYQMQQKVVEEMQKQESLVEVATTRSIATTSVSCFHTTSSQETQSSHSTTDSEEEHSFIITPTVPLEMKQQKQEDQEQQPPLAPLQQLKQQQMSKKKAKQVTKANSLRTFSMTKNKTKNCDNDAMNVYFPAPFPLELIPASSLIGVCVHEILLEDFVFIPTLLEIEEGDVVVWKISESTLPLVEHCLKVSALASGTTGTTELKKKTSKQSKRPTSNNSIKDKKQQAQEKEKEKEESDTSSTTTTTEKNILEEATTPLLGPGSIFAWRFSSCCRLEIVCSVYHDVQGQIDVKKPISNEINDIVTTATATATVNGTATSSTDSMKSDSNNEATISKKKKKNRRGNKSAATATATVVVLEQEEDQTTEIVATPPSPSPKATSTSTSTIAVDIDPSEVEDTMVEVFHPQKNRCQLFNAEKVLEDAEVCLEVLNQLQEVKSSSSFIVFGDVKCPIQEEEFDETKQETIAKPIIKEESPVETEVNLSQEQLQEEEEEEEEEEDKDEVEDFQFKVFQMLKKSEEHQLKQRKSFVVTKETSSFDAGAAYDFFKRRFSQVKSNDHSIVYSICPEVGSGHGVEVMELFKIVNEHTTVA